jgi:ACR3 family arsenite transporter
LVTKVAGSSLENKGEKVTEAEANTTKEAKGLSFFEKYLSVWVALSIVAGIALGKVAPGVAKYFDGIAIYVGEAPVVSIPIAICLFFMMYPIMVKIDFGEVLMAGKNIKSVGLTLFVINPTRLPIKRKTRMTIIWKTMTLRW